MRGRLANTTSFVVKQSSAAEGEETKRTVREPQRRSKMLPCFSERACRLRWTGSLK